MKVFITKYWETHGIQEVEILDASCYDRHYVRVKAPHKTKSEYLSKRGSALAFSQDEAVTQCIRKRNAALKKLDKRAEKLRNLIF